MAEGISDIDTARVALYDLVNASRLLRLDFLHELR